MAAAQEWFPNVLLYKMDTQMHKYIYKMNYKKAELQNDQGKPNTIIYQA